MLGVFALPDKRRECGGEGAAAKRMVIIYHEGEGRTEKYLSAFGGFMENH